MVIGLRVWDFPDHLIASILRAGRTTTILVVGHNGLVSAARCCDANQDRFEPEYPIYNSRLSLCTARKYGGLAGPKGRLGPQHAYKTWR